MNSHQRRKAKRADARLRAVDGLYPHQRAILRRLRSSGKAYVWRIRERVTISPDAADAFAFYADVQCRIDLSHGNTSSAIIERFERGTRAEQWAQAVGRLKR